MGAAGNREADRRRVAASLERLVAALAEPGCPVCRCLETDARQDLAGFLREQTMDPIGRAALRAAGGFCAWHTGLLREAADGILSVALIAEDVLAAGRLSRAGCPACAGLAARADEYLRGLLEPAVHPALATGPGLPCRPHLARARDVVRGGAGIVALEAAIAPRLSRLRADLAGFIAKQDYRSAEPPSPQEARAWSEALEHLAGWPTLFGSDLPRA